MALPTIRYDASGSGSDSLASGAGPDTPVNSTTESSQAYSGDGAGGGTQTIITFDSATDLSNVAVDGSHALRLDNTAGERHIFKIVGKGADTVTVSNAPSTAIASGSPVNWAIGGWRQTLDDETTWPDWKDASAGWALEFKVGTYSVAASITGDGSTTDYVYWRAEAGAASKPIIQAEAGVSTALFSENSNLRFFGLELDANGAVTSTIRGFLNPIKCTWVDCNIVGASDSGMSGISGGDGGQGLSFFRCNFSGNNIGVNVMYRMRGSFFGCKFFNNVIGIKLESGDFHNYITFHDCLIYDNTNVGVSSAGVCPIGFFGCTIEGNTNDGIIVSAMADGARLSLVNNIFSKNGGYGINYPANEPDGVGLNHSNAFHNNTSGARNNWPVGTDDIEEGTLTVDPFVNSNANDYHLNNTASGGALLRATGAVGDTNQDGSRDNFGDRGPLQHEDTGGGGGDPGPIRGPWEQGAFR